MEGSDVEGEEEDTRTTAEEQQTLVQSDHNSEKFRVCCCHVVVATMIATGVIAAVTYIPLTVGVILMFSNDSTAGVGGAIGVAVGCIFLALGAGDYYYVFTALRQNNATKVIKIWFVYWFMLLVAATLVSLLIYLIFSAEKENRTGLVISFVVLLLYLCARFWVQKLLFRSYRFFEQLAGEQEREFIEGEAQRVIISTALGLVFGNVSS